MNGIDITDLMRDDSKAPITNVRVAGRELKFDFWNPNYRAQTELREDGTLELYIGKKGGYDPRCVTQPSSVSIPDGTLKVVYRGEPK